jgi:hypothetical protein
MPRCCIKIRQCIFFTIIILFIIILIKNNFENKIFSGEYENISNKLIMERLKSHARFFDDSSSPCTLTRQLNRAQMQHMDKIVQVLTEFRQQIKPTYAEIQFHGRGIVLSVGIRQISLTKVNLKMIERTKTRLPVQVELKMILIIYQISKYLLFFTIDMVFILRISRKHNNRVASLYN